MRGAGIDVDAGTTRALRPFASSVRQRIVYEGARNQYNSWMRRDDMLLGAWTERTPRHECPGSNRRSGAQRRFADGQCHEVD